MSKRTMAFNNKSRNGIGELATGVATGRPEISGESIDQFELKAICSFGAIGVNPERIDMGKCVFCGACAEQFPSKIKFTRDVNLATNIRDRLIVFANDDQPIRIDQSKVRSELKLLHAQPIPLTAMHFSAAEDFQIDDQALRSTKIQFVDTLAQGIVITGQISGEALPIIKERYENLRAPKLMIVCGTAAIASSVELAEKFNVDLFVPGSPVHLNTFVEGILEITQK